MGSAQQTLGSGGRTLLDRPRARTYSPQAFGTLFGGVLTGIQNKLITHLSRAQAPREEPMAKLKFRPLHDRVVVKRIDAEEKTKGGIIIPDTAKEKPSQGEITAVGPGGRDEAGKLIPIDLRVGDRVLFGKWSGTEVKIEGDELLIMKESDIMGVIA